MIPSRTDQKCMIHGRFSAVDFRGWSLRIGTISFGQCPISAVDDNIYIYIYVCVCCHPQPISGIDRMKWSLYAKRPFSKIHGRKTAVDHTFLVCTWRDHDAKISSRRDQNVTKYNNDLSAERSKLYIKKLKMFAAWIYMLASQPNFELSLKKNKFSQMGHGKNLVAQNSGWMLKILIPSWCVLCQISFCDEFTFTRLSFRGETK
jgi:hypothetical protein